MSTPRNSAALGPSSLKSNRSRAESQARSLSRDSSLHSTERISKPAKHGAQTGSLVNIARQNQIKNKVSERRDLGSLGSDKTFSSDSEIDAIMTNEGDNYKKKLQKNTLIKSQAVMGRIRSNETEKDGFKTSANLLDRVGETFESKNYAESPNNYMESYEEHNKQARNIDTSTNVGFGFLPDQVYKKAVRKGFEFSLMVVGESGLGKSTLVNSMFLTDIYSSQEGSDEPTDDQTLQVETHQTVLEENGVRLALTVVDTPGFGDAVDNTDCWQPIIDYVEKQFEDYLEGETRIERVEVPDTRVHACLYFIAPTGHGLKPLDIQFMKRIHEKVNIIPVIGKADACTHREVDLFKSKILVQLEMNEIRIYDFPEGELGGENNWMRSLLPFAVVGSNTTLTDDDGTKYRGREYPWGTVNIEDQGHCDFSPLRHLLLATHMQDLKEVTHGTHYENFRREKLNMMGSHEVEVNSERELSTGDEDGFKSFGFEWEQTFGKLSNERLEHLQRIVKNKEGEQVHALSTSTGLNTIGLHRQSFMKGKRLWNKTNSVSLLELRQKLLGQT